MAFEIIWSPSSKLDLQSIFGFIAPDNPAAAAHMVHEIIVAVDQLTDFPQSGRVVPEFEDETIRELIKPPFRIVYRVKMNSNTVQIARVWHAARGIPQLK